MPSGDQATQTGVVGGGIITTLIEVDEFQPDETAPPEYGHRDDTNSSIPNPNSGDAQREEHLVDSSQTDAVPTQETINTPALLPDNPNARSLFTFSSQPVIELPNGLSFKLELQKRVDLRRRLPNHSLHEEGNTVRSIHTLYEHNTYCANS